MKGPQLVRLIRGRRRALKRTTRRSSSVANKSADSKAHAREFINVSPTPSTVCAGFLSLLLRSSSRAASARNTHERSLGVN